MTPQHRIVRRRTRLGQATIEMALLLPVLVVVLIGVQTGANLISSTINVTNAARAGAQAAADTLDTINGALSCTQPATPTCIDNAKQVMTEMVDQGLQPLCDPPMSSPDSQECRTAVYDLATESYSDAVQCILNGLHQTPDPCQLGRVRPVQILLNQAENDCGPSGPSPPPMTCKQQAEGFARAAMAAALAPGCDCKRASVEIIGGMAEKALACTAARRALGPQYFPGHPTCNHKNGDSPWIETTVDIPGNPIPVSCDNTTPDPNPNLSPFCHIPHCYSDSVNPPIYLSPQQLQLFATICASPTRNQVDIERITLHLNNPKVVATATAIPASQFTSG
jgi:hypothetical protein